MIWGYFFPGTHGNWHGVNTVYAKVFWGIQHTELNQILTKRKALMKLSKTHENAEMDT